jgi:meso-butanediol dehydrogenase / (S,S)-butanediol dehydrogenase / diacetyl reductase
MARLDGRVALVTGGGSGIGRAIALRLARDGADVAVGGRRREPAEAAVREIQTLGRRGLAVVADVCVQAQVRDMVAEVVRALGRLDIMVANAGIVKVCGVQEVTEELWDRMMNVNAKGVFFCDQAAAEQMVRQGQGGRIINAASDAGRRAVKFASAYSASKFAVVAITQSFALELAPHQITVNAYCPGIVDTPIWKDCDGDLIRVGAPSMAERIAATPLGRAQSTEDVANLVAFLASDEGDFITGQAILQNGGRLMM